MTSDDAGGQVRFTLETLARAVRADGGDLQLLHVDEDTKQVEVGYRLDSDCEQCVLTPEQLEDLVVSALSRQLGDGVSVRMTTLEA